MAVTDYNKQKLLDVDSVSGTPTVDKATPILITSNILDDLESGSSKLDWESNGNVTVDTNSEINGSNSLQFNASSSSIQVSRDLAVEFGEDGDVWEAAVKIDNQSSSSDKVYFEFTDAEGNVILRIWFNDGGNVEEQLSSTQLLPSWSANTVYNITVTFDFTNNNADIDINGTTTTSVPFFTNTNNISAFEVNNDTDTSAITRNVFLDDYSFKKRVAESDTGNGYIGIDFTNISSESDLAVYDQNDNLLPYEIESFDATSETATLWCYDSWVRDGSTQAQVVYGEGTANQVTNTVKEVDGFEDGDFSSNPTWTSVESGGTASVQSSIVKEGSNALEIIGNDTTTDRIISHDRGASDGVSDGDVYQAWVRTSNSSDAFEQFIVSNSQSYAGGDDIVFSLTPNSDFRILTFDGAGSIISDVSFGSYSSDAWYRFEIELNPSTSTADFRVYDIAGNLIESQTSISTSGASNLQYVNLRDTNGTSDSYFDDISYSTTDASVTSNYAEENVEGVWNNTGQNLTSVHHNEDALDSTTNNIDYTTGGAPTSITGTINGAFSYDGTDDYHEFTSSTLNGGRDNWAAQFWVKSTDTAQNWILGGRSTGTNDGRLDIRANRDSTGSNTSGALEVGAWDGSGSTNSFIANVDSTSPQWNDGNWHLVSIQFDYNTDTLNVWIDGASQTTTISNNNTSQTPADNGNAYHFAGFNDGGTPLGNYLDVELDEVKFYDTSTDIDVDVVQAEYDASPAGGQVFFSQQAAQDTATTISQTVSDGLSFQENQAFTLKATLSDSVGFQENSPAKLIDTLNDNLGFTENLQAALAATLTDDLGFNENTAATYIDTLSDQLNFTEQTLEGAIGIVASDNLTFGEQLDSQLQDTLADQLSFQENLISQLQDTLTDQLQFQEQFNTAVKETLQDQLGFQENVASALADTLTDQLTLQDQITARLLIDLNITQPTQALITTPDKFVTMDSHVFKENDLGDKLAATLQDENGAIDISGAKRVEILVKDRSGTKVMDKQVTITDGVNGEVEYQWVSGDPIETAGVYRAEFKIVDANDENETIPNDGFVTLEIEEEIN